MDSNSPAYWLIYIGALVLLCGVLKGFVRERWTLAQAVIPAALAGAIVAGDIYRLPALVFGAIAALYLIIAVLVRPRRARG